MTTKICPKCKEEKDAVTDFPQHQSGKRAGKAHSYCKRCKRAGTRDWEKRNPERKAAYQAAYQNKYQKLSKRKDRRSNPSRSSGAERVRTLRKYGKDLTWYSEAMKSQDGKCAICRGPEVRIHPITKNVCSLAIDHDHETGLVRGLLCSKCNIHLHVIETIPGWAASAALYLERFLLSTA